MPDFQTLHSVWAPPSLTPFLSAHPSPLLPPSPTLSEMVKKMEEELHDCKTVICDESHHLKVRAGAGGQRRPGREGSASRGGTAAPAREGRPRQLVRCGAQQPGTPMQSGGMVHAGTAAAPLPEPPDPCCSACIPESARCALLCHAAPARRA